MEIPQENNHQQSLFISKIPGGNQHETHHILQLYVFWLSLWFACTGSPQSQHMCSQQQSPLSDCETSLITEYAGWVWGFPPHITVSCEWLVFLNSWDMGYPIWVGAMTHMQKGPHSPCPLSKWSWGNTLLSPLQKPHTFPEICANSCVQVVLVARFFSNMWWGNELKAWG